MDIERRDAMRDYAWKYFSMHADQRLKTFNFYLILVTVILGGVFAYIKDAAHPSFMSPVGFLLAVVSYLFWRLDIRTQELIRHAENALKRIEQDGHDDGIPVELRLFEQEESKTEIIKSSRRLKWSPSSWWGAHYSYSNCFHIVFWLFGLCGVAVAIGVFLVPTPQPVPAFSHQRNVDGTQPAPPQRQP
jgi:hypothetical protein